LTIWGSKDRTVVPALTNNARNFITDLQNIVLEDSGHWVMLEAKDEVTEKVSSWLLEHESKPVNQGRL
jgi:soluble epoxide hydrolase/lipid-phosphate phosphatase